jgi:elongation factor G
MGDNSSSIHNVALIGHEHTGKTTLAEAFLHHAGKIKKMGGVKEGNTVSDFDPDEREQGKSRFLSTLSVDYRNCSVNLLDVPGTADSIWEVLAALRAVECTLVCVDATAESILVNTRKYWKEAEKLGLPRIVSLNRLDASKSDYMEKLAQIKQNFSKACVPLFLPDGSAGSFTKVYNVLEAGNDAPDFLKKARTELVEEIVETDEDLFERYMDGQEIPQEELAAALLKAVREGGLFPVVFTSAEKGIGVKELMDAVVSFTPSPADMPKKGIKDGTEISLDGENGFVGFVYKTVADEYVTRISHIRVFAGKLSPNSSLVNRRMGETIKVGGIYRVCGKELEEIGSAEAGDMVAITKVEHVRTGDCLTDAETEITLEEIKFPIPMVSLAVKPKTKSDEQKISTALKELEGDDPTFLAYHDSQTGDLIISGMSDTHLRLMLKRLKRKNRVEVDTAPPRIPYRETVTRSAQNVEYTHKKQSGGAGQYAKVVINLEPLPRGKGYEFTDKIVGGVIDQVFRPSVDKGIQAKMLEGIIAGYPVADIRVTLVDGKTHPVDSKDIAFQIAGREALKHAFMECRPTLIEPIVKMEIVIPQDKMGDIMGDLNSRRGRILTSGTDGPMAVVAALVPLAEIQHYQADLKSLTGGEGSYTLEFDHYDIVPANRQAPIIEAHKKELEEKGGH